MTGTTFCVRRAKSRRNRNETDLGVRAYPLSDMRLTGRIVA
jgi:hypothetical protein